MKKKRKHLPRPLRTAKHLAEAAFVYLFFGICRVLPVRASSSFGGWMGRLFGHLAAGTSRRARKHLDLAFPEKTDAEKDAIVWEMWDNLGRVAGEYAHLQAIKDADDILELQGGEHIVAARQQNRPVLVVSAHFGNWEVGPMACEKFIGLPLATVYRRPNNPYVAEFLERLRRPVSPDLFMKGREAIVGLKRAFSEAGAVGLLVDQRSTKGMDAPFFGYVAPTIDTPLALAMRANAVILPAQVIRLPGMRLRTIVYPPLEPDESKAPNERLQDMVFRMNAFLEKSIREYPGQWLWLHRRWGKIPKKFNNTERVA